MHYYKKKSITTDSNPRILLRILPAFFRDDNILSLLFLKNFIHAIPNFYISNIRLFSKSLFYASIPHVNIFFKVTLLSKSVSVKYNMNGMNSTNVFNSCGRNSLMILTAIIYNSSLLFFNHSVICIYDCCID